MKEDIKFPTILKSIDGSQTVVVYKDGSAYHIDGEFKGEYSKAYNTDDTVNAANDVLANTYGKVESKEHAEFIVELAEVNHLDVYVDNEEIERNYFTFNQYGKLFFYECSCEAVSLNRNQITIPMQPKEVEDVDEWPECPEYQGCLGCGSLLCLGGCGDNGEVYKFVDKLEQKEWPQIGDEVLAPFKGNKVKATLCWQRVNIAGINVSLVFDDDSRAFWCATEDLSKPKSPEEELRDELASDLNKMQLVDSKFKAGALLAKYNITKKPQ